MAFPQETDIRLISTDNEYSQCLLYITCTEQTLTVGNNVESVFRRIAGLIHLDRLVN